jgi:hypothetical protein
LAFAIVANRWPRIVPTVRSQSRLPRLDSPASRPQEVVVAVGVVFAFLAGFGGRVAEDAGAGAVGTGCKGG